MCSSPAWSQPAERTVHQWRQIQTGNLPAAPNRIRLSWLGAPIEKIPLIRMPPGSTASMAR
jgi:hypothetical protein